ncbi:MAG: type II secretion system F family protein [Planctomycetes bacterium]|nr:type II secretion system F family protein [Planctomycetota bacterium]
MPIEWTAVLIFVSITAGVLALASHLVPSRDRVAERVRRLSGAEPEAGPGSGGRFWRDAAALVARLFPAHALRQDVWRLRLIRAGFADPQAPAVLLAARLLLVLVPVLGVAAAALAGALAPKTAATAGVLLAALGAVAPGFWLDARKAARQNDLRRGLPDFFDVLVLCIEGGMALPAAWRRVTSELREVHPPLWRELKLVEHEAEIGRPMSAALDRFAERTDLDEVASLTSVVGQAERLGTELAGPLRALSDALRLQRVQRAEEEAHKTATNIMFPTLLFIFPGVFAIILGPMIVQVMAMFSRGK